MTSFSSHCHHSFCNNHLHICTSVKAVVTIYLTLNFASIKLFLQTCKPFKFSRTGLNWMMWWACLGFVFFEHNRNTRPGLQLLLLIEAFGFFCFLLFFCCCKKPISGERSRNAVWHQDCCSADGSILHWDFLLDINQILYERKLECSSMSGWWWLCWWQHLEVANTIGQPSSWIQSSPYLRKHQLGIFSTLFIVNEWAAVGRVSLKDDSNRGLVKRREMKMTFCDPQPAGSQAAAGRCCGGGWSV